MALLKANSVSSQIQVPSWHHDTNPLADFKVDLFVFAFLNPNYLVDMNQIMFNVIYKLSFLPHFKKLSCPCGLFTKNKIRKIAFFCNIYFAQKYF